MNVRYYVARVADANVELLSRIGITAGESRNLRRVDTYTRFHKEQFEGATLHTFGGLIAREDSQGISGYYEIRNADSGDIAATFVITTNLVDLHSEQPLELPPVDPGALEQFSIDIPEHGKPRSLSLAQPRHASYDELKSIVPDNNAAGGMNGRREGIVLPDECDDRGILKEGTDPMFVLFRPQPGEDLREMGPPVLKDEHGRRYSWAMMEIRNIDYERPSVGDVIVSMSADVKLGEKWRHSRRWLFSKESGELYGISDHAALCMDLDARKAIPIPAAIRQSMEEAALEEFL